MYKMDHRSVAEMDAMLDVWADEMLVKPSMMERVRNAVRNVINRLKKKEVVSGLTEIIEDDDCPF